MLNRLEKYTSFNIDNKLTFIDSFQFLSSSLYSLIKNLGKNDFYYLNQEFYGSALDLIKQKRFFYSYKYLSDVETFREELIIKLL